MLSAGNPCKGLGVPVSGVSDMEGLVLGPNASKLKWCCLPRMFSVWRCSAYSSQMHTNVHTWKFIRTQLYRHNGVYMNILCLLPDSFPFFGHFATDSWRWNSDWAACSFKSVRAASCYDVALEIGHLNCRPETNQPTEDQQSTNVHTSMVGCCISQKSVGKLRILLDFGTGW